MPKNANEFVVNLKDDAGYSVKSTDKAECFGRETAHAKSRAQSL